MLPTCLDYESEPCLPAAVGGFALQYLGSNIMPSTHSDGFRIGQLEEYPYGRHVERVEQALEKFIMSGAPFRVSRYTSGFFLGSPQGDGKFSTSWGWQIRDLALGDFLRAELCDAIEQFHRDGGGGSFRPLGTSRNSVCRVGRFQSFRCLYRQAESLVPAKSASGLSWTATFFELAIGGALLFVCRLG